MSFENFVMRQTGATVEELKKECDKKFIEKMMSSLWHDFMNYIADINERKNQPKFVHDVGALEFRAQWYEYENEYLDNWER